MNINDIIHFDNGVLLSKAEDKLMFLAFCMEYRAYYPFLLDDNQTVFHTHLPIQLDATCNGFQHMSLLSNKDTLFSELNLMDRKKDSANNEQRGFL